MGPATATSLPLKIEAMRCQENLIKCRPTSALDASSHAWRDQPDVRLRPAPRPGEQHAAEHIEPTTAAARERVLSLAELARALGTLPAARTKARRGATRPPAASLAVALLQARRRAFQHAPAPDDLVLPTLARDGKGLAPISGWNWLKRELDRASGVAAWRLHDFRRSLVTVCAEQGAEVAVLDSLLNHATSATRGGVIGTYQRATLLEPMRKVMAQWDRLLADELRGEMPAAAVVALRTG